MEMDCGLFFLKIGRSTEFCFVALRKQLELVSWGKLSFSRQDLIRISQLKGKKMRIKKCSLNGAG